MSTTASASASASDETNIFTLHHHQHQQHQRHQQLDPQLEDDQNDRKKKRNRKPVTCAQCRKRKLKCDRNSPCGACKDRNEGDQCEWEGAIRLPQSNYTRDQEAIELRSQLDRLEGLLTVLSGTAQDGNDIPVGRSPSLKAFKGPVASASASGSGMVNGNGDLDNERTSAAAEALGLLSATSKSGSGAAGSNESSHLSPFSLLGRGTGTVKNLETILTLLPNKSELDSLVQSFLSPTSSSAASLLPILFHVPTFLSKLKQKPSLQDPSFVAVLFAISSWESLARVLNGSGGAKDKDGMAGNWVKACLECFSLGNLMENPTIDSIRALIILFKYYVINDLNSFASFVLGTAVRLALVIGLNRDPSHGGKFGIIVSEERRRIWSLLLILDWTSTSSRTYQCSPLQYDTARPTNIPDSLITPTSLPLTNPTTTRQTPVDQLLFLLKLSTTSRAITDRVFGLSLIPSKATIEEFNNVLLEMDNALLPSFTFEWVEGAVKQLEKDGGGWRDLVKVEAQLALRKEYVRLNRPFLTRGFRDTRFAVSREKCCVAARYILAIYRGLGEDPKVARNWTIVFHTLNALCVLAIDLWQDPNGTYASLHHVDVLSSLKILESNPIKSLAVKETIRVVGVLLKRAFSSGGGNAGNRKRKQDEIDVSSGYRDSSNLYISANSSLTSPIPVDSYPSFDVVDELFSIPLPLPISVDPFASASSSMTADQELAGLWTVLKGFSNFYGLPDQNEWDELCRNGPGGAWIGGIDLLQ